MKTAVSLPANIFAQAERVARRLNKSRSALYREALAEYVARHEPGAVTEAMNRALADVHEKPDPFVRGAARKILRNIEW